MVFARMYHVVVVMIKCGCNPVPTPIEFELPLLPSQRKCKISLKKRELDLEALEKEVICDYNKILKNLRCGIQPDLFEIKNKISMIDLEINYKNIMMIQSNGHGTYLKYKNFLSEFDSEEEKDLAVKNLGLNDTEIITERNYKAIEDAKTYKTDTIYFVIPDPE